MLEVVDLEAAERAYADVIGLTVVARVAGGRGGVHALKDVSGHLR